MLVQERGAPGTFAARVLSGFLALCAAFVLDAAFASVDVGYDAPVQLALGLAIGLLLVLCAGALLIPLLAFVAGVLARVRYALYEDALGSRSALSDRQCSARYVASFVSLLAFAPASFWVARECVLVIARPENIALAIAASHVVLVLLLFGLRTVVSALYNAALTGWAHASGDRTPLDRPRVTLSVLLLLSGLILTVGAWRYEHLVLALPWRAVLHWSAMGAAACAAFVFYSGQKKLLVLGTVLVLFVSSLASSFLIRSRDYVALDVFERELKSASLVAAVFTRLMDFDRDGHRGVLGGGDCRPHDPRIYPGAPDIPGNKIDEDCDGKDLGRGGEALLRGRTDHPVPGQVPARFPIVLITIDAFAAKHLKAFGYPRDTAPHLEQLIAKGALFENCFAQGPSTRLSLPSLFISRYDSMIPQELIGRFPYPLDQQNLTLAEVLRSAGYRTYAVVPSAYFTRSKWLGLTQGFDVVDESVARGEPAFNADKVTDAALVQLSRAQAQERPVFLWVHYFDPHAPHKAPPNAKFPGPSTEDIYDSELAFTDQHLGRLVAEARQKLGDNTLFLITGDHGYGFHGKRYARGGYGYDLNTITLHVPLIASAPFVPHTRIKSLCSTIDVAPTIVNLARVNRKLPFQGYSLVPELISGQTTRPQFVFHQFFLPEKMLRNKDPLNQASVRTLHENYVLDRYSGKPSLWRWDRDYAERIDLASDRRPDVQRTLTDLRSKLAEFVYATTRTQSVTIHPSMTEAGSPPSKGLAKPAR